MQATAATMRDSHLEHQADQDAIMKAHGLLAILDNPNRKLATDDLLKQVADLLGERLDRSAKASGAAYAQRYLIPRDASATAFRPPGQS